MQRKKIYFRRNFINISIKERKRNFDSELCTTAKPHKNNTKDRYHAMDNDLRLRRTRRNKDNKIFGKKILMCLSAGCFNAFNGGYHRVINKFIRKFYKILFT